MHCAKYRVRKIVQNVGLSKTLVRALPYGIVWVDEPSSFVVFVLANYKVQSPVALA